MDWENREFIKEPNLIQEILGTKYLSTPIDGRGLVGNINESAFSLPNLDSKEFEVQELNSAGLNGSLKEIYPEENRRIESLIPGLNENLIVNREAIDLSSTQRKSLENILADAKNIAQNHLEKFRENPKRANILETAFGKSKSKGSVENLITKLTITRNWPSLKILSGLEIKGSLGAYNAEKQTIYLSADFLRETESRPELIAKVILEELGHHIDATINKIDSSGDEGAIFSKLVFGEELSKEQLEILKQENDFNLLNIEGKSLLVELASDLAIEGLSQTQPLPITWGDSIPINNINFSLVNRGPDVVNVPNGSIEVNIYLSNDNIFNPNPTNFLDPAVPQGTKDLVLADLNQDILIYGEIFSPRDPNNPNVNPNLIIGTNQGNDRVAISLPSQNGVIVPTDLNTAFNNPFNNYISSRPYLFLNVNVNGVVDSNLANNSVLLNPNAPLLNASDREITNTNALIYNPRSQEAPFIVGNPVDLGNNVLVYRPKPFDRTIQNNTSNLVNLNNNYVFTNNTAPTNQEVILNIAADWRVSNQGTGVATAGSIDGFYLSSDPILDGSDLYLTSVFAQGNNLEIGKKYDASTLFSVGLSAVENQNYKYLLIASNYTRSGLNDFSNPRAENNLSNNVAPILLARTDFTANNPYNFVDGKYATAAPLKEGGIEVHSGALTNFHSTPTYTSLGVTRGVNLRYDSLSADPRHIIHFGYKNLPPLNSEHLLAAKLRIEGINFEVPGGPNNEHFWPIAPGMANGIIDASLLVDMSPYTSGIYNYSLATNIQEIGSNTTTAAFETPFFSDTANAALDRGQLVVINNSDSDFGSGWALVGLQELFVKADPSDPNLLESVLLIDGDGRATFFNRDRTGNNSNLFTASDDFSKLIRNANGSFTRTLKNGTVYNYAVINNRYLLTSITDTNNNTTTHGFDSTGRLLTITDPVGLVTRFDYGANGKVRQIKDPAGKVTKFEYDRAGNLTRIVNPNSSDRRFQYDNNRHLIAETDERNNTETVSYNPITGRATQGTHADRTAVRLDTIATKGLLPIGTTFNPFGALRAMVSQRNDSDPNTGDGFYVDENKNRIDLVLDRFGQALKTADPISPQTRIERDLNKNLIQLKIDPLGNRSQLEYDTNGNLIKVTEAVNGTPQANDNGVRTYTYDAKFNQLTSITDEKGNQVIHEIDPNNGNLLKTIEVIGVLGGTDDLITQYTYTARGLVATMTDAEGRVTRYSYDEFGRRIATIFAAGTPDEARKLFEYDLAGNLIAETDENGNRTRYVYDIMNRQIEIIKADPDGIGPLTSPRTVFGYDFAGNLIAVTDARNNTTTYIYDNRNRQIRSIDPLNRETRFDLVIKLKL